MRRFRVIVTGSTLAWTVALIVFIVVFLLLVSRAEGGDSVKLVIDGKAVQEMSNDIEDACRSINEVVEGVMEGCCSSKYTENIHDQLMALEAVVRRLAPLVKMYQDSKALD